MANEEARPSTTSTHGSIPPSPYKQPTAAQNGPPALEALAEAGSEETTDAVDSHVQADAVESAAEAGSGSFFLTGGGDLSPSRVHSDASGAGPVEHSPVHVPVERSERAQLQAPSLVTVEAEDAGERKKERMANHIKWIKVIAKHGLPWFNAIPDQDVLTCIEAIRNTKNALQARFHGWQSSLASSLPVKITVKGISIVDMAAMDLGGTSDPFCVIEMGGMKNTTSIIKETLSPRWTDLEYHYTAYDCSMVLVMHVWDWDDGSDNDFIGRCYIHVEDIIRNGDQEVSRALYNDKGAFQGQATVRFVCESISEETLPSDEPDTCARLAASLTRILWHLGVPRAKAAFVLKVILRAEAPMHVIQRLGEVGVAMALYMCEKHWLVNMVGRWKLFADFQMDRREKIRRENAPKLAAVPQQSWDEKLMALQRKAAKDEKGAKVNVSKHINMQGVPKGNREDNLRLALAFCDRSILNVSDPEKAESMVEEFQDLHQELDAAGAGHESLALDLMAEILAKYEREARLVDQVDEEVERVQKAVKADQGPDGVGLLPHQEPKKNEAHRWLKHRTQMEKQRPHMPLDYYLDPYVKANCKDIMHMRQAVVDMGYYFMQHVDETERQNVGPAILAIAAKLKEKVAEIELAYEKKMKAMGKLGAGKGLGFRVQDEGHGGIRSC